MVPTWAMIKHSFLCNNGSIVSFFILIAIFKLQKILRAPAIMKLRPRNIDGFSQGRRGVEPEKSDTQLQTFSPVAALIQVTRGHSPLC